MKQVIRLEQNTPEWEAWRNRVFGASDAAAMLGISPYKTRANLIAEKLGRKAEINDYTKEIFRQGHEAEKAIMPHLEENLDTFLAPSVVEGENGIAASLDGINFEGTVIVEHKLLRDSAAAGKRFALAEEGKLQEHDMAQVQQQLMVSGAAVAYFVVSDGTPENVAIAEVLPDEEWFARIKEGWKQFAEDLEKQRIAEEETIKNETLQSYFENYRDLELQIKALQEEQKEIREILIKEATDKEVDTLSGEGIVLKKIESKGTIDYKAIPELKTMDLEQYRKPSTTSWRINVSK